MKNEVSKKKITNKKNNTNGKVNEKVTKELTVKKSQKKSLKESKDIREEVKEDSKKKTEFVETTLDEKKSNKGDIFLILGLVVIAVLGFWVMQDKNAGPKYELPLTLSGEAGLHQLTYSEYQEKIDNKEEFVVILERATCSHCVTYMPIAEQFASDNNLPMYYVDTDTFTAEDWEGFEKSNSYLRKAKGDWGTPTTLVLAGSETVDYVVGVTEANELKEMYNKYFDIEKE